MMIAPEEALSLAAADLLTRVGAEAVDISGAGRAQGGEIDRVAARRAACGDDPAGRLRLRHEGWRGRRAALLNLCGFALVAIVLPLTHFAA